MEGKNRSSREAVHWRVCLALFLISFGVGMAVPDSPWENVMNYILPYAVKYFPPIYETFYSVIPTHADYGWVLGKYYRPLFYLPFVIGYMIAGDNFLLWHLIYSMELGAVCVMGYLLFSSLSADPRRNFLAALLFAFSPPILCITWSITYVELVPVFLYLASLTCFQHSSKSRKLFILTVVLSTCCMFAYELLRALLPLSMIALLTKDRNKTKMLLMMVTLATSAALLFATLVVIGGDISAVTYSILNTWRYFPFKSPTPHGELEMRPPLTPELHIMHNLFQLVYPFFIGGCLIVFVSALTNFLRPKYCGMTGGILLISAFAIPPIRFYSFDGHILFTSESFAHLSFFSMLLLLGLILKVWRERGARAHSLVVLSALLLVTGVTYMFAPVGLTRYDVSSRTYIYVLPFLSWIISDAVIGMKDRAIRILLAIFMIMLAYHVVAEAVNQSAYMRARASVDYESYSMISSLNLSNSTVGTTHCVEMILPYQLRALRDQNFSTTRFTCVPYDSPQRILGGRVIIYHPRIIPLINHSGEFNYTFPYSCMGLCCSHNFSEFVSRYRSPTATEIDLFLSNLTLVGDHQYRGVWVTTALEDVLQRASKGYPLSFEYVFRGRIYEGG